MIFLLQTRCLFYFHFLFAAFDYSYQEYFAAGPNNQELIKNRLSNTQESNHICINCTKSYKSKGGLVRHLKFECGKRPRFQCTYCPYKSKQRSNMYLHIKNRHKGQEMYVVDLESH